MNKSLSGSDAKKLIRKTEESFRHDECATCEYFLGYVTQLEIDSDPEGQKFLQESKPDQDQIHSYLGCDPCAPEILYTNYLKKRPKA